MKRSGMVWVVLVLVIGMAGTARPETETERPGAYYWGDSGSLTTANGTMTSGDCLALQVVLMGGDADFSGVYPPSPLVQDLDGNGVISSQDKTACNSWLIGSWSSSLLGRPAAIRILTPTPTLFFGESVTLSVRVTDNGAGLDGSTTPRWGFGAVFEITGGCETGITLIGRDPTPVVGGGRDQIVYEPKVFEYTDLNGEASVRAAYTSAACAGYSTEVSAYVPGDAEAGISGERFPTTLYAAANPIVINGTVPPPYCTVELWGPDTLVEGESQNYTAVCTYWDSWTEDCTASTVLTGYGNISCVGSTCTAWQVPGPDGGSGWVEGFNDPCYDSPYDQIDVTVNNDDSLTSTLISCPSTVEENNLFYCSTTETWSDAYTVDATLGQTSMGDCSGSDGSYTAGHIPGPPGGSCLIFDVADNSPVNVTIEDPCADCGPADLEIYCPASVNEGQSFYCSTVATWWDGATWDETWGQTSAGNCTGADGSFMADQIPGPDGGVCYIADDAYNSPVTVPINNDDIVLFTRISPDPVSLSALESQQFQLTRTYTDAWTEDLTGSAGWSVCGGDCGALSGSIDGGGLYTAGDVITTCVDQICTSTPTATNSPVPVTVSVSASHSHYEVAAPAFVVEGASILGVEVWDVDTNNHHVVTGDPVSVAGDCGSAGGPEAGTLTGATAGTLAPQDNVAGDVTAAWSADLVYYNVAGTNQTGAFYQWNLSAIPAGARIDAIRVRATCASQGGYTAGSAPYLQVSLNGGASFTGLTTLDCAAWVADVSEAVGTTIGLDQLPTQLIVMLNDPGGRTNRSLQIDQVVLDIDYTTGASDSPSLTADQVPCGAGGSCSITAADIGGEVVQPATVEVLNDDTVVGDNISGPTVVMEGMPIDIMAVRTWSDGCTEELPYVCSGDCTPDCFAYDVFCGGGGACFIDFPGNPIFPFTVTVENDDNVVGVNVQPDGPVLLNYLESQAFTCTAMWSDGCTEDCSAALVDDPGCGSLSGPVYTADLPTCTDTVSATWWGQSDATTVEVQ